VDSVAGPWVSSLWFRLDRLAGARWSAQPASMRAKPVGSVC